MTENELPEVFCEDCSVDPKTLEKNIMRYICELSTHTELKDYNDPTVDQDAPQYLMVKLMLYQCSACSIVRQVRDQHDQDHP